MIKTIIGIDPDSSKPGVAEYWDGIYDVNGTAGSSRRYQAKRID